ncbi:MAG: AzlD domain-containing protein [Lachnospiraceae bacterium]
MIETREMLLLILGCALVTWIPRILPFALSKAIKFPPKVLLFLEYLPVCILTALLVQGILKESSSGLPTIELVPALALVPTLLTAIKTKDLVKTVLVGCLCTALLRLL